MTSWHPKIVNNGSSQVTIPAEILRAVGLKQGDAVYVGVGREDPRTVVLVPGELFDRWLSKGQQIDGGIADSDIA